jgi:hypothetical protein
VLDRAVVQEGPAARFGLLFLAHFEANLTGQKPCEPIYERVAAGSGREAGECASVREVTDVAFGLSGAFRETTTPGYFEMLGMGREYKALADAAWLGKRENQGFAFALANRLWEAAGRP